MEHPYRELATRIYLASRYPLLAFAVIMVGGTVGYRFVAHGKATLLDWRLTGRYENDQRAKLGRLKQHVGEEENKVSDGQQRDQDHSIPPACRGDTRNNLRRRSFHRNCARLGTRVSPAAGLDQPLGEMLFRLRVRVLGTHALRLL